MHFGISYYYYLAMIGYVYGRVVRGPLNEPFVDLTIGESQERMILTLSDPYTAIAPTIHNITIGDMIVEVPLREDWESSRRISIGPSSYLTGFFGSSAIVDEEIILGIPRLEFQNFCADNSLIVLSIDQHHLWQYPAQIALHGVSFPMHDQVDLSSSDDYALSLPLSITEDIWRTLVSYGAYPDPSSTINNIRRMMNCTQEMVNALPDLVVTFTNSHSFENHLENPHGNGNLLLETKLFLTVENSTCSARFHVEPFTELEDMIQESPWWSFAPLGIPDLNVLVTENEIHLCDRRQ
jgi:hypothetical protein